MSLLKSILDITEGKKMEELDITEKKVMENKLVQMNEILRLLNKTFRHDILNELTVINTYLEMYKKFGDEKSLNNITKSVESCNKLIENMMELESLVSSGANLKPCNAREVIMEGVGNYPQVKVHGDCVIMADNAFCSVIKNLVSNALSHGKADKIDITVEDKDQFCEIRVADNGTGITDRFKEKVFEEGFSNGNSTGLGLYIVRRTVERWDGHIHVQDNHPSGAIFVIRLRPAQDSGIRTNLGLPASQKHISNNSSDKTESEEYSKMDRKKVFHN